MARSDIHKTAVIMPFSLHQFLQTLFGFKESSTCLQASDGLGLPWPRLHVHVPGRYPRGKPHGRGASEIPGRSLWQAQGTRVGDDLAKCVFAQPELKFLGRRVASDGIRPAEDKVKAIRDFPQPVIVRQLMEFNGMVNFCHHFVQNAAKLMSPLYDATSGMGSGKSVLVKAVEWMPERDAAFQRTKEALVRATGLCHFMPGAPLVLTTNGSDFAVSGVLEQWVQGIWQLLAFYTSRFKPPQPELCWPMPLANHQRSATNRELFAPYHAVMHFRHFLEGRHFTLFMDHKPLVAMMVKISDTRSAMQARHLAAILEFTTAVQHLEGKPNVVADALSWIEIDSALDPGHRFLQTSAGSAAGSRSGGS